MKINLTKQQIISIVLLVASIAYDLLPVDFIADYIPFFGWFDDILITSSAAANCFQQFVPEDSKIAKTTMKWMKWTMIILAVLIIIVVALLAGTIYSLCK